MSIKPKTLSIHSFVYIPQILTDYLLWAMPWARYWDCKTNLVLCLSGAYPVVGVKDVK